MIYVMNLKGNTRKVYNKMKKLTEEKVGHTLTDDQFLSAMMKRILITQDK